MGARQRGWWNALAEYGFGQIGGSPAHLLQAKGRIVVERARLRSFQVSLPARAQHARVMWHGKLIVIDHLCHLSAPSANATEGCNVTQKAPRARTAGCGASSGGFFAL